MRYASFLMTEVVLFEAWAQRSPCRERPVADGGSHVSAAA